MSFLQNKNSKIFIAGHRGMVGSSIFRKLNSLGFENVVTRSRTELDLTNQSQVNEFFRSEKPRYVFLAAARVGGIKANNDSKADFLYENLMIEANVIRAAADNDTEKLLFLGSSCIYPKLAPQPLKEDYLLTGPLEPTNDAYALAKIAGLKLCEFYNIQMRKNFISGMPCNLYGPGDTYHLEKSHVIPSLILKIHRAKNQNLSEVELWGTGSPYREFMYVDDCADALIQLMDQYNGAQTVNIGTGSDLTIRELSELISNEINYKGRIVFNPKYPDGTPKKVLDTSKINAMGWFPKVQLKEGVRLAYQWALENNKL